MPKLLYTVFSLEKKHTEQTNCDLITVSKANISQTNKLFVFVSKTLIHTIYEPTMRRYFNIYANLHKHIQQKM